MAEPIILVVDDDPQVLAAIRRDLRSRYRADYRVLAANSGEAALDAVKELKARGDTLAMLISDQRMPAMLGVDLLTRCREIYPVARRVLRHLWTIDEELGKVARANRERTIEQVLAVFRGQGAAGDTTGNSPGTKWVAFNAIAEHLDYGRRYTTRTNQVQRSFEDTALKQRALELVLAA